MLFYFIVLPISHNDRERYIYEIINLYLNKILIRNITSIYRNIYIVLRY